MMKIIKNNIIKILSVLGIVIFLTNCTTSRSAMGLDKGEVNFSLILPMAASCRVGITDNIEARVMSQGAKKLGADLFFHTHFDSNQVNYGVSLGTRFDHRIFGEKSNDKPAFNSTITISKKLKRFTPYMSFSYDTDDEVGSLIAVGTEYSLYKSDNSSFTITLLPEIIYFVEPKSSCIACHINTPRKLHFSGLLGIGFTFDLL